jgi:large subunit ribosomal protein L21
LELFSREILMYAVIQVGGKQRRVQVGDVVRVERREGNPGDALVLDEVLAMGSGASLRVGTPRVAGATVRATVVEQGRGPKIVTYVFKHRQNANRKRRGHRQDYTAVRIDAIEG